jgi:N6-adenosine-specific RNA methylase IME4
VGRRTVSQFLISIDDALRALAEARTPEQLIDLSNRAEALRRYAQRARLGMAAQNRCAELRLRAERTLGQYLTGTPRNSGGRPKPVPLGNGFPTLEDLGITRKLSHRAQRIAAVPTTEFEWYLRTAHKQEWEITTRLLLRPYERRQTTEENRQRVIGGRVDDLIDFARNGPKMGCIVVDPSWPMRNALPYLAIDQRNLKDLPIPDLAAERCHLHLWTLPNRHHVLAYEIIEHWGFRPVSEFVWVKPSLGRGSYWRMSHETLVTAVRSDNDRFDDRWLRSWVEAPRGRHSEKPESVRALIERASPAPRLELFARTRATGWYAWGHEIADRLINQGVEL